MIKPEFSASLLQTSVSIDPSEIILIILLSILSMMKIVVQLNIFVEIVIYILFLLGGGGFFVKHKFQHLFEIDFFCNNVKLFTIISK